MVVTMLEAEVAGGLAGKLTEAFNDESDSLPLVIRESFLIRESGGDLWRIVTVWESKEALDRYRASVDTPGGVLMFRSVGAEPALTVFEVAAHADHN
ncbi:MAG: hypothetical protein ACR2OI_02160 [Acidimicrobiia bacterium]